MQHTQQEDKLTEWQGQKTGVTKAEHLIENVAHKRKECSEQESDAQVSFSSNVYGMELFVE